MTGLGFGGGTIPLLVAKFLVLGVISTVATTASTASAATTTPTSIITSPTATFILTATTTATSATAASHLPIMLIGILFGEVVAKVDTFRIHDCFWLLLFKVFLSFAGVFSGAREAQKRIRIDLGLVCDARVGNVQVGLQLVLRLEGHVALGLARVVGADVMGAGKVDLEGLVVVVEHVTEVLSAQMARQMVPLQVLVEDTAIKEELLAEVTPGVGQNFGTLFTRRVSMLNVHSQFLHVVDPLLANKHGSPFEANQAESLLMSCLHMPPHTLLVRERLLCCAVCDKTSQCSKLHSLNLGGPVVIVNGFISAILVTIVAHISIKLIPSELLILSDDHLF